VTTSPAGPSLGAVVLAAGESQRMGGRPKPLIERDGVPLVRRVAQALVDAGVDEVVVVLGHRAQAVAAALASMPVTSVVNAAYAEGRISSLRAGLGALSPDCEAILVALADQPLLEAADVAALVSAFRGRGAVRALVPRVDGVRGHPVIFERSVRDEILAGGSGFGVRQWLDANPGQVGWVDSDRPGYIEDVDSPEDLQRIAQRHGCAMRWP